MISKILDKHKQLAEDLGINLLYVAMSTDKRKELSNEILEAAGMEADSVEFEGIKNYMGIQIRTQDVPGIRVVYGE